MASVLILEDDAYISYVWAKALEGVGHKIRLVRRASDALKIIAEQKFDLIISDVFIEEDGVLVPEGAISLLGKIRCNTLNINPSKTSYKVPVIVTTGSPGVKGGFDPLQISMDVGADLVIRKPFSVETLLEVVDSILVAQPKTQDM